MSIHTRNNFKSTHTFMSVILSGKRKVEDLSLGELPLLGQTVSVRTYANYHDMVKRVCQGHVESGYTSTSEAESIRPPFSSNPSASLPHTPIVFEYEDQPGAPNALKPNSGLQQRVSKLFQRKGHTSKVTPIDIYLRLLPPYWVEVFGESLVADFLRFQAVKFEVDERLLDNPMEFWKGSSCTADFFSLSKEKWRQILNKATQHFENDVGGCCQEVGRMSAAYSERAEKVFTPSRGRRLVFSFNEDKYGFQYKASVDKKTGAVVSLSPLSSWTRAQSTTTTTKAEHLFFAHLDLVLSTAFSAYKAFSPSTTVFSEFRDEIVYALLKAADEMDDDPKEVVEYGSTKNIIFRFVCGECGKLIPTECECDEAESEVEYEYEYDFEDVCRIEGCGRECGNTHIDTE